MEEPLTAITTRSTVKGRDHDDLPDRTTPTQTITMRTNTAVSNSEDALQLIRSKPDLDTLKSVLRLLDPARANNTGFNIGLPSPQAAQLIHVLVETTIADFWSILYSTETQSVSNQNQLFSHAQARASLLRCLANVTGLGAIVARLRALLSSGNEEKLKPKADLSLQHVSDLLDVLVDLLKSDDFAWTIWGHLNLLSATRRMMIWKELISLLCMGKLLSTVAEATYMVSMSSKDIVTGYWVGDGAQFSAWIGRNAVFMASQLSYEDSEAWKALAEFLGKSISLGYADRVVEQFICGLLISSEQRCTQAHRLLAGLQVHENRTVLYSLLRFLAANYFPTSIVPSDDDSWSQKDAQTVSGAAAILFQVLTASETTKEDLVSWLTGTSGGGLGDGIGVRRAVVAALSRDEGLVQAVMEKDMQQFGDKLYIKHTPILHQEVNTQILLLVVGYVYRSSPKSVAALGRSSVYLNAISNRLSASSPRSHFLGMIVGTAISNLIDKPENKMLFTTEEMDSAEARWYLSLTQVQDKIGTLNDLHDTPRRAASESKGIKSSGSNSQKPSKGAKTSKIISIEEVSDNDADNVDDDEFQPYEKPDSDEEDEEEDPTLVQRNKVTVPVYIRDLTNAFRDTENYDRQRLALSTAASLIRRKASFGTEVSDHAEELAALLTGLPDKFDMERFQEMRLQAMMALLVARPLEMGQWYSRSFFEGDYSISQRASILNALGMGARELGGYAEEDGAITSATSLPGISFPSKKLPQRLHNVYSDSSKPVNALAANLEKKLIEPMAADAADKLSGPNALKVRTFSSRMAVEQKRKPPKANPLAKIVGAAFVFPLTGRWWVHLKANSSKNLFDTPPLAASYLKTLALIFHAAGSTAAALPQMTSELWDLLLSLRTTDELVVVEGVLFALLTLLEVNVDHQRRLAEAHSRELLETQGWASTVFEAAAAAAPGAGQDDEGERVRMLAASVLVRTRDVVEKYQRLLVGDMLDL